MNCADCQSSAEVFCKTCQVDAPGLYLCCACSDKLHSLACRKDHELLNLCQQCERQPATLNCASCCKLRTLCFCDDCSAKLHRPDGPRAKHRLNGARFTTDLDRELGIVWEDVAQEKTAKRKKTNQPPQANVQGDQAQVLASDLDLAGKMMDADSNMAIIKKCQVVNNPGGPAVVSITTSRPHDWVKELAVTVCGIWPEQHHKATNHISNAVFDFQDNLVAAVLFAGAFNQCIEASRPADRITYGQRMVQALRINVGKLQQTDMHAVVSSQKA